MPELDKIDLKLLKLLQEDAQITSKELSTHLNLSQTPIYERIKRLERDGYIKQYVAILDKEKMGKPMVAFCNVSLKEHAKVLLDKFQEEIMAMDEVMECYHIAGTYDYILKVVVGDIKSYQDFIVNKLATLANVSNAHSSFVLTEIKHTTSLPI
ncbi:MAG: Lrp/AsnC family transcriptional regulator [Spirosomataceae bacterium]